MRNGGYCWAGDKNIIKKHFPISGIKSIGCINQWGCFCIFIFKDGMHNMSCCFKACFMNRTFVVNQLKELYHYTILIFFNYSSQNLNDAYWPQLFHDVGRYHIETSPLICRANQWTGFYMIMAYVMKELSLDDSSKHFDSNMYLESSASFIEEDQIISLFLWQPS